LSICVRRTGFGMRRSLLRSLLLAAAVGAIVIPLGSFAGLVLGERDCGLVVRSAALLTWGSLCCAALMIWLAAPFKASPASAARLQPKSLRRTTLQSIVSVIGALLAITVWFQGPGHSDGSIHLSFGANQNILATAFLTLGGFALWRRGWIGVLSAIPWFYLSILTTSRLAVLVIPILAFAVPMDPLRPLSGWRRLVSHRLITGPALVMVAATFLIAPIAFLGVPLPYKESAGNIAHAKEWMARQGRSGRIVAGLFSIPPFFPNDPVGVFHYSASISDDRFQLWAAALKEAGRRPVGVWPCTPSFQTQVRLPDGAGMSYSYTSPHNMTLELMLVFGWMPGFLALIGSLALAWMSIRSLATCDSLFVAAASIGCLVELIRVQFSGNLWDLTGLLIAGLVVAASYATRTLSSDRQLVTSVEPYSSTRSEG